MDQAAPAPEGRRQAGRQARAGGARRAARPDRQDVTDARPDVTEAGPDGPDGAYPGAAPPVGWMLRAQRPDGGGDPRRDGGQADPDLPAPRESLQAVGATPARHGRPGGPGLGPDPRAAAALQPPPGSSPWLRLDHRWAGSAIAWDRGKLHSEPEPAPNGTPPGNLTVPFGAPVVDAPGTGSPVGGAVVDLAGDTASGWVGAQGWEHIPGGDEAWHQPGVLYPDGDEAWHQPGAADPDGDEVWPATLLEPPGNAWQPGGRHPARRRPAGRRQGRRQRLFSRRAAAVAVPVIALAAVAILALALLTGHSPKAGPLAADQQGNRGAAGPATVTAVTYPGQSHRGVFQNIGRIVSYRNTVVAIGAQSSDSVVRQQFFVSADGGASWRLAPVTAPGGGQPPLGFPAARLAGGPRGWLAVGPQATWTSPDGQSWTLAATRGITPMLPGDAMWVLNGTSDGFLAAGVGAGQNGSPQAVIWTSRDGLTWQRETAAQLGLAGPGETVQSISYITARGDDTVMSGTVAARGTTYSAAWLSTDGGAAWTRVSVPAGHGAGTSITGLGIDGSGLIAIRPGRSATGSGDGVAYFSVTGRDWRYAATIAPAGGWTPSLVKGSDYGFVVTGVGAGGQILAYTSSGTGTRWQPAGPLGDAAHEGVAGATVGAGGAIVAVGSMAAGKVSQQPLFLEVTSGGRVRQISLTGIPGAVVPEVAVNGLASAGGQQVAVGSAGGYPAVWRKSSGGSWILATSLAQVSADQRLRALTSVTHGSSGWLAVGTPGPAVFTSADGTTWQPAAGPGSITDYLAGVAAVAAAAGPAGYVIVGKLVAPGGACVADVWWSPDLTVWTRAHDVNDVAGSSQVLAVAAGAHGFVSAGSHDGQPAVWTTTDGRTWTTIVLPAPPGASSAVLQQIAVNGNRIAALGQEITAAGSAPFAELSADGGAHWTQAPFTAPGPDMTFTALTADAGGFTAAGQFGEPGQQQAAIWTSANGTTWTPVTAGGLTGPQPGGTYRVVALAPAGSAVTGIASITTQQSQRAVAVAVPAR